MTSKHPKHVRILAISPSCRGFGFAVLEDQAKLVDWAVKTAKAAKIEGSLVKVEKLIADYQPHVLVLEDHSNNWRRSNRVKVLSNKITAFASKTKIKVKLFSREQLNRVFFGDGIGTKHTLAKIIADRFPEQLGFRIPRKRRAWMSEDYRMDIFDAAALALAYFDSRPKRGAMKRAAEIRN
jgi:Holliday junction resolvasome RuvABC endonuclease subunit